MKILYLIHGHKDFSVGGAENAAFSLFEHAQSQPGVEAWILAAAHTSLGILGHGEIRSVDGRAREYLIGSECEWYRFTNTNITSISRSLSKLLHHINPDVIHLQHYSNFGIDIIPLLQRLCPSARIIVTLHEYLALCMHNGQMVKTNDLSLCSSATALACSRCFPERSPEDMFLRSHYIRTILESCDALISPSHFLIQRYTDNGLRHQNFRMIENGLPGEFDALDRSRFTSSFSPQRNRFAFFGQLNIYKGVLLLFQAAAILKSRGITNFSVDVYGANLEMQSQDFQDTFNRLYDSISDIVQLRGRYKQSQIVSLILASDWVVMPSIWWENSPVVIQESFFFQRPVIGSDIGGVNEKVDGCGGISFPHRNASGLADVIENAIGNVPLHTQLHSQMQAPFRASDCFQMHLALYQSLLASAAGEQTAQSSAAPLPTAVPA